MWKNFLDGLGKFVQKVKEIFSPKKEPKPAQLYINNKPIGELTEISWSVDNYSEEEKIREALKQDIKDLIIETDWANIVKNIEASGSTVENELGKFGSILYPILPKHYSVKTLILTMAASQPYEYQSVDMSQYEEKGIAHYIMGTTRTPEEIEEEFQREVVGELSEEELEELVSENDWVNGMMSAIYHNAHLYYYEEFGIWDMDLN